MAKKLSEDELKWILSVDATEAQQGIRSLTKDNDKLKASNKELKNRMIDLIATGKRSRKNIRTSRKKFLIIMIRLIGIKKR